MQVHFIGCGDAFGSGGRFNTCFHVTGARTNLLIDCGASSLVALKQAGIDRNEIRTIVVTHFHADHFGGIPFFILDAQFFSKRTEPLTIVAPPGLESWFERAMETAFPGSSGAKRKFEVTLTEIAPGTSVTVDDVDVAAFQVNHGNPGGPYHAYRITAGGRTIAYTGDTEWTETLVDVAADTDLFIAEAYHYDKQVHLHLDYTTLMANRSRLATRRMILTHMTDDMLARVPDLSVECARDGLVVDL